MSGAGWNGEPWVCGRLVCWMLCFVLGCADRANSLGGCYCGSTTLFSAALHLVVCWTCRAQAHMLRLNCTVGSANALVLQVVNVSKHGSHQELGSGAAGALHCFVVAVAVEL